MLSLRKVACRRCPVVYQKLIEFSKRHADEELHEYLMTKPDKVLVHNKCRRDYVDEK